MSGIKVRQDGETLDIATADTGGFKVEIGGVEKSIGLVDVSHAKATKIRCRVGGVTKAWKKVGAEPFDVWIEAVATAVYKKSGISKAAESPVYWDDCWDIALADYNADPWTLDDNPYVTFGMDSLGIYYWPSGKWQAEITAYKGKISFDLKNIPGGYDWEDVTVAELWVAGDSYDEYAHSITISPFGSFSHPIILIPNFLKLNAMSYMGNENFEVEFTNSSYDAASIKPAKPSKGVTTTKGGIAANNDIRVISYG